MGRLRRLLQESHFHATTLRQSGFPARTRPATRCHRPCAAGGTGRATVFVMAKKTRRAVAADANAGDTPRRPCPCGSGKRYKACHGAGDDVIVPRPFAGLAAECELVAMREFLPSATGPMPLADPAPVTLTTVLPGASAAL